MYIFSLSRKKKQLSKILEKDGEKLCRKQGDTCQGMTNVNCESKFYASSHPTTKRTRTQMACANPPPFAKE